MDRTFAVGATLERFVPVLAPLEVVGDRAVPVRDLAYDTRSVSADSLFFCVRGARVDGHDLAGEAVRRGASALVVERRLELSVPQLVVPDVRRSMPAAAVELFGDPTASLPVAGVTGTNGKTTTTFLLREVLDAAGLHPGLLGTIERRVGSERRPAVLNTPEAIDLQRLFREMLEEGNRSCVMEATSEASAQGRLDGTRFAALVFTNLTQDHLNFHGTMEAYFAAKRRLFLGGESPAAAVNVGDRYGRRLAEEIDVARTSTLLTYGFAPDADIRVEELELVPTGARLRTAGLELHTRLRGRFNVENVLAAVAAARLLGVDDEAIAAGVAAVGGVPGRFEALDEGQPFTVLVDYAHTPDSLRNVLGAARALTDGQLICVFGCGGDRDRGKRPLMGRVVRELADVAIVTSDNPRSEDPLAIIEEIVDGRPAGFEIEPDRRAAIGRAIDLAEVGDAVLVAGKGHEQGQQFRDRTLPFDDREVAREALRRAREAA